MDSNRCLLCNDLIYDHDESRMLKCIFCGCEKSALKSCSLDHFVCDTCMAASAMEIIKVVCETSDSSNPFHLMELITKHPSMHNHGPEYHTIVPAVLLTAYYNAIQQKVELSRQLNEAFKRSEDIPVGSCGFNGLCGAAMGAGIFMSLILHTTPLSLKGWKNRNQLIAGALNLIATEGDPRCCKRNAYLVISHTIDVMRKDFNIPMDKSENISCVHVEPNQECIKSKCRYYQAFTVNNTHDRISAEDRN